MAMGEYYRIQPAGLGIKHRSETSTEELAEGLHVFEEPWQTLTTDVPARYYGDEVVVISAPGHRSTDDVEGVEIDHRTAKVIDRMSLDEWANRLAQAAHLESGWSYDELREEYDYGDIEDAVQAIDRLPRKKRSRKAKRNPETAAAKRRAMRT
jgi:hypothetical protein